MAGLNSWPTFVKKCATTVLNAFIWRKQRVWETEAASRLADVEEPASCAARLMASLPVGKPRCNILTRRLLLQEWVISACHTKQQLEAVTKKFLPTAMPSRMTHFGN